ncbi:GGDEF domain-containing protein [Motiliproteus sp.]|uniref:GGDEF domain-containing protein n=1 Tax=Motiliproteus sp. TaxID=1898955 RepID=UPI003BAAC84D
MSVVLDWIRDNFSLSLAWLLCLLYGIAVSVMIEPVTEPLDWISLFTEGCLMLMPAVGLYLIRDLRKHPQVYAPLFIGLTLILLALMTDTLDEFVDMPALLNGLVEGAFQVIGYLSFLVGLKRWAEVDAQQIEHLSQLATTDSLTGIYNRRYFVDALSKETYRSRRYHEKLSVILFDIDRFKQVNDRFGHNVGDTVLIEITHRVREVIRDSDLLARYGGEEFMLLAPNTSGLTATQMAEKIRLQLQQNEIQGVGTITASFGVSEYRSNEVPHDLLTRVDQALYRAKSSGRNTVIFL